MNGFLFPGQGSQECGMGKIIYEELASAREILEKANDIVGFDLKELMFEGPIEKLTETQYAQPAIYTCSAMYLEKAREKGIEYQYVAGHSLGEYSALYAAGVFPFEDGLRLVSKRGEAMAAQNGQGTMAAVLGLTEEELLHYLIPGVVIANLNTKTQIVISGIESGIDEISRVLSEHDIKVKKLSVSAAFHSPQMKEAAEVMKEEIEKTVFHNPSVKVISNVTGKITEDVQTIKENLIAQITGQVRWYDSILAMKNAEIDQFYEIGNGQVLRKMNKTITLKPKCSSL